MRSELIFRAHEKVANRYKLCHTAAKVTRCLHFSSTSTHDAIIDAFVRIAHEPCLVASDLAPDVAVVVAPAVAVVVASAVASEIGPGFSPWDMSSSIAAHHAAM